MAFSMPSRSKPTRSEQICSPCVFPCSLDSCPLQDVVVLNAFGVVVNALGSRVKPYLPQICGTVLWRLNNKAAKVRQQAADLISRIANVMMQCGEVGVHVM